MLNQFLKYAVRGYQKILSPFLPPSCRFYPTCSEYAAQALDRYPLFKACRAIIWRLLKCHPYHQGGHDPVP